MTSKLTQEMSASSLFPSPVIFEPISHHSHTIIMLHGRGSNGLEFANELFEAQTAVSNRGETLRSRFPSCRWVFPSSREFWSSTFEEEMAAWFEADSLTDISAKSDLQVIGIKESVGHLRNILNEEIMQVMNDPRRIVIGGISQGAALGYWLLLTVHEQISLGGYFAASSWLPFDRDILKYFAGEGSDGVKAAEPLESGFEFVKSMIPAPASSSKLGGRTPILIGHGIDDAYVDVELGKSARDVFRKAGYSIQWTEYDGADEEGHWFKEPDQIEAIARYISQANQK
jgi:lysophospholipase-2